MERYRDKKIAGLLGAVAGLATLSTAQAATNPAPDPAEALQASSYADLLGPNLKPRGGAEGRQRGPREGGRASQ